MSNTQTVQHEEIELRTPGPSTSTSGTFDFSEATPAQSTTHLQSGGRPTSSDKDSRTRVPSDSPERGPDDAPGEGAVEVAPEGGYGWVVVASCSVAM
jgi:hypothetical protein